MDMTFTFTDEVDTAFERFFKLYERTFSLPHDTRAEFEQALRMNTPDSTVHDLFLVLSVKGHDIGGANFLMIDLPDHHIIQLNYLFVAPGHRGRGHARNIIGMIKSLTPWYKKQIIFLQMKDPRRMTRDEFADDVKATGMDQCSRLRAFGNMGFYVLDFDHDDSVFMKSGKDGISGALFKTYLECRHADPAAHQGSQPEVPDYVESKTLEESSICQTMLQ